MCVLCETYKYARKTFYAMLLEKRRFIWFELLLQYNAILSLLIFLHENSISSGYFVLTRERERKIEGLRRC